LASNGISFEQGLDHLIFNKDEVLKNDGTPYLVYTPYSRRWKELLEPRHLTEYPSENLLGNCLKDSFPEMPSLAELGFKPSGLPMPDLKIKEEVIRHYDKTRDFPALSGTSRLGPALRFGLVSIRHLVRQAREWNATFLNELIWREFYAMILMHFPKVVNTSFRPEYDRIEWRNNEKEFERWKEGQTGFLMVDAGMRQLAATGFMHNRLRMITASFLTKHLLIDWRWGEAWFAEKLFDFELSSNNGGWQWSAGTGTDAAPYFRIFNPTEQQKKFDPEGIFVKKWVPELDTEKYPEPIVDHKAARERCLAVYKRALI
jgi:deoxyribodipyrimidine photo-lyase